MYINQISYERLVSTGDFCNVKIGAVATLSDSDSEEDAFRVLRGVVDRQVDNHVYPLKTYNYGVANQDADEEEIPF